MTYDEMIEVIQAAKEGKIIEYRPRYRLCDDYEWTVLIKELEYYFCFGVNNYRVQKREKEKIYKFVYVSGASLDGVMIRDGSLIKIEVEDV